MNASGMEGSAHLLVVDDDREIRGLLKGLLKHAARPERHENTMATIGTRLYTWRWGDEVGRDPAGNRYYRHKKGGKTMYGSLQKERRWVIHAGEDEASRVPPEWHGWLHHTTDKIPPADGGPRFPWMKEHVPNLTGTDQAYRPPGHTLRGGKRDRATGDYEPWTPG